MTSVNSASRLKMSESERNKEREVGVGGGREGVTMPEEETKGVGIMGLARAQVRYLFSARVFIRALHVRDLSNEQGMRKNCTGPPLRSNNPPFSHSPSISDPPRRLSSLRGGLRVRSLSGGGGIIAMIMTSGDGGGVYARGRAFSLNDII